MLRSSKSRTLWCLVIQLLVVVMIISSTANIVIAAAPPSNFVVEKGGGVGRNSAAAFTLVWHTRRQQATTTTSPQLLVLKSAISSDSDNPDPNNNDYYYAAQPPPPLTPWKRSVFFSDIMDDNANSDLAAEEQRSGGPSGGTDAQELANAWKAGRVLILEPAIDPKKNSKPKKRRRQQQQSGMIQADRIDENTRIKQPETTGTLEMPNTLRTNPNFAATVQHQQSSTGGGTTATLKGRMPNTSINSPNAAAFLKQTKPVIVENNYSEGAKINNSQGERRRGRQPRPSSSSSSSWGSEKDDNDDESSSSSRNPTSGSSKAQQQKQQKPIIIGPSSFPITAPTSSNLSSPSSSSSSSSRVEKAAAETTKPIMTSSTTTSNNNSQSWSTSRTRAAGRQQSSSSRSSSSNNNLNRGKGGPPLPPSSPAWRNTAGDGAAPPDNSEENPVHVPTAKVNAILSSRYRSSKTAPPGYSRDDWIRTRKEQSLKRYYYQNKNIPKNYLEEDQANNNKRVGLFVLTSVLGIALPLQIYVHRDDLPFLTEPQKQQMEETMEKATRNLQGISQSAMDTEKAILESARNAVANINSNIKLPANTDSSSPASFLEQQQKIMVTKSELLVEQFKAGKGIFLDQQQEQLQSLKTKSGQFVDSFKAKAGEAGKSVGKSVDRFVDRVQHATSAALSPSSSQPLQQRLGDYKGVINNSPGAAAVSSGIGAVEETTTTTTTTDDSENTLGAPVSTMATNKQASSDATIMIDPPSGGDLSSTASPSLPELQTTTPPVQKSGGAAADESIPGGDSSADHNIDNLPSVVYPATPLPQSTTTAIEGMIAEEDTRSQLISPPAEGSASGTSETDLSPDGTASAVMIDPPGQGTSAAESKVDISSTPVLVDPQSTVTTTTTTTTTPQPPPPPPQQASSIIEKEIDNELESLERLKTKRQLFEISLEDEAKGLESLKARLSSINNRLQILNDELKNANAAKAGVETPMTTLLPQNDLRSGTTNAATDTVVPSPDQATSYDGASTNSRMEALDTLQSRAVVPGPSVKGGADLLSSNPPAPEERDELEVIEDLKERLDAIKSQLDVEVAWSSSETMPVMPVTMKHGTDAGAPRSPHHLLEDRSLF